MVLFWTFDKCAKEALKYSSRMEFKAGCNGAYWGARKRHWLDGVCSHMILNGGNNPKGYWTKERCKADALKYNTKKEYRQNSSLSWEAAKNHNWTSEICSHMKKIGNRYDKCVYAYEFSDMSVYIGLTYSLKNRQLRRDSDLTDQVTRYIEETGLVPIRKQLTDYIPVDEAIFLEGDYVTKYRVAGWNILNMAKTGSIGGNVVKWTYEVCKNLASKYQSRRRFKMNYGGAYNAAYVKGWIDDICSHMKMAYKPVGYWTYEHCKQEAAKYERCAYFEEHCQYAYQIARKNGWLSDFYGECMKGSRRRGVCIK